MSYEIIIDKFGIGNAVVIRDKHEIIDYFFDPPESAGFYPPQTFLRAKVERCVSGRGGYFIKLPDGKEGFLVTKKRYDEGAIITVVSRVYYEVGKAQRFSDKLRIVSELYIIEEGDSNINVSKRVKNTLDIKQLEDAIGQEKLDIVLRSKLLNKSIPEIRDSIKTAIERYKLMFANLENEHIFYNGLARDIALDRFGNMSSKILEEEGIFESLGIWDKLYKVMHEKINFGIGSYLYIQMTNSICAIDVNSGKDLKIRAHEINIKACEKIYYLIKQRGIGGKIIIDFLPCSKKFQNIIYQKLYELFFEDGQKNIIWGWTRGGCFEIERERDKTPINLILDL